MARWFAFAVVVLALPAAAAWLAWELRGHLQETPTGVSLAFGSGSCDGKPAGSIRVNEDGSVQVCVPR